MSRLPVHTCPCKREEREQPRTGTINEPSRNNLEEAAVAPVAPVSLRGVRAVQRDPYSAYLARHVENGILSDKSAREVWCAEEDG